MDIEAIAFILVLAILMLITITCWVSDDKDYYYNSVKEYEHEVTALKEENAKLLKELHEKNETYEEVYTKYSELYKNYNVLLTNLRK